MIDVFYLSLKKETPCNSYWDYTFLNDFIDGKLWLDKKCEGFNKSEVSKLPKRDKAIVVLPARHHTDMVKEVKGELKKIDKCVLFLMGDEEADFPVEEIDCHAIWVQNPHPGRHDKYNKLGTGYAPIPKMDYEPKSVDMFFSGQLTHKRRFDMWEQLLMFETHDGSADLNGSKGFTQGFEPKEYFNRFRRAKVATAPSGAVIPDSFRLHEAMEMMCMPLADDINSQGTVDNYWEFMYGEVPFIKVKDWKQLRGYTDDALREYPYNMFAVVQWWIEYKRSFANKVMEQLYG